jgi:urease accessory protein
VLEIHADVAAGGALDLLPEPTVAVRGCRHRMVGRATVGAGGWLRWREEILLGRFGEAPGHVETDLRVDVRPGPAASCGPTADYLPLLRQQLALGPDVPGLAGAALLGSARAVGSLLIAAPPAEVAATAGLGIAPPVSRKGAAADPGRLAGIVDGARPPGPAGLGVAPSVSPADPVTDGHMAGGSAVLPLAGPGVLITALAPDAVTLRRHLDR